MLVLHFLFLSWTYPIVFSCLGLIHHISLYFVGLHFFVFMIFSLEISSIIYENFNHKKTSNFFNLKIYFYTNFNRLLNRKPHRIIATLTVIASADNRNRNYGCDWKFQKPPKSKNPITAKNYQQPHRVHCIILFANLETSTKILKERDT